MERKFGKNFSNDFRATLCLGVNEAEHSESFFKEEGTIIFLLHQQFRMKIKVVIKETFGKGRNIIIVTVIALIFLDLFKNRYIYE